MTADATLPAPDDLTPEVLAQVIDRVEICRHYREPYVPIADALALLSGVRSLQAKNAELRKSVRWRQIFEERTIAAETQLRSRDTRIMKQDEEIATLRQQRHDALEAVAARDAVIHQASTMLWRHGLRGGWEAAGTEAKRILSAAPSSVLAARDAEKWDEGSAARQLSYFKSTSQQPNPYRAGVDQ